MSLSVNGVIRVCDDPVEVPYNGGLFLNFTAEGKNRRKRGERFYYRVSMFVPEDKVQTAKEELKKGVSLYLHHADLEGNRAKSDPNYIYNQIKVTWSGIDMLVMTLQGDTQ